MDNKVSTSALFIEMRRWFNEKMSKWMKQHENNKHMQDWVDMLNNSHVYCREEDEEGHSTGNWFRITGIEDHGPNLTLIIKKPNGKIEV